MDFYITSLFSTVYEDLTLIYDTCIINAKYNPRGNSIQEIAQALGILLQAESKVNTLAESNSFNMKNNHAAFTSPGSIAQLNKYDLLQPQSNHGNRLYDGQSQRWAREEIWEFFYYAVISFTFDHLSQFPFWKIKVLMCCDDSNALVHDVASRMMMSGNGNQEGYMKPVYWARLFYECLFKNYTTDGIFGLFHGCIPYLVAAYLQNITQMQMRVSNLLKALMMELPVNSTGFKIARSLSRASFVSLTDSTPTATNQQQHSSGMRRNSHKSNDFLVTHEESADKQGLTSDAKPITETRIQRLLRKITMHPFLLASVHMITDPMTAFHNSNWLMTTWKVFARYGMYGFFSGWRVNMMFSLFPWAPIWSLGIYDTIVYRCMLDQSRVGVWRIVDNILQNTPSSSSAAIESSIANYSWQGTQSLLKFGVLTIGQMLPGFLVFAGCRSFLWMTLGISRKRREQYRLRKDVLEQHYGNLSSSRDNSQVSLSFATNAGEVYAEDVDV